MPNLLWTVVWLLSLPVHAQAPVPPSCSAMDQYFGRCGGGAVPGVEPGGWQKVAEKIQALRALRKDEFETSAQFAQRQQDATQALVQELEQAARVHDVAYQAGTANKTKYDADSATLTLALVWHPKVVALLPELKSITTATVNIPPAEAKAGFSQPTPQPLYVTVAWQASTLALSTVLLAVSDKNYPVQRDVIPPRDNIPSSGKAFRDCADCPEMVSLPGGLFQMGSDEKSDEKPVHSVTVGAFALGKYEVTKGEFAAFVKAAGYKTEAEQGEGCYGWTGLSWEQKKEFNWKNLGFSQEDNHPVACVSWNDAVAYTDWLSAKTGKEYRLPTEAEWEYAARGGTTTNYWWGNDIDHNRANCYDCGSQWDKKQTAPVGSFAANPFGLHDTAGNVWEWSCSEYAPYKDGKENACISKNHASSDGWRVIRGGSWYFHPSGLRSSYRFNYRPSSRSSLVGFRLARMF